MGRIATNRKVYHITLDKLSRKSLEFISDTEGMSLSHAISKTILEYMTTNYSDKLDYIRHDLCNEQISNYQN